MKALRLILMISLIVIMASHAFATIPGKAVVVSMLNQDPDPAIAGDTLELRFALENFGDKSTNEYFMEFAPAYPFEQVAGEPLAISVGSLSSGMTGDNKKIVKFKVMVNKDATAGTYSLPIMTYEKGERNADAKRLYSIEIQGKESAEIIYIDQVELVPGKITPMKFTIHNVGSTPLRDLTFNWENQDDVILPVGSDNTKYVKYIDVGDSAELNYTVVASASATPNLYKLDLTLIYNDPITDTDKEINTIAGVYVGGATDFDVVFSGISSGESSFSVANIGSVSASSVTVKIPQQPGWTVTGSSSVIIGNLNEGDYTIAGFTLQQAAARNFTGTNTRPLSTNSNPRTGNFTDRIPSQDSIKIDIIYTDSRGNRNTITKEVPISLQSTLTASGTTANGNSRFRQQQDPVAQLWDSGRWIILGIAILIAFLAVQRKYRKGRLDSPDYTYMNAVKDLFRKKKAKK